MALTRKISNWRYADISCDIKTNNGTFDGFSAVVDQPEFKFTATGIHPTQGGFNVQGQDEISNIDVFYTALTSKKGQLIKNTEARLFNLNYNDSRNSQVVDNRPALNQPFLNQQALDLHTLGMHLLSIQPIGAGKADGLLWGAYQLGDWTGQDQQAFAVDAEVGYQWDGLPLKPWFRAVYNYNSGDGNPNDQQHQTFFSVLPSGRIFAKFPFYNLMNLEDAFLEMIVFPTSKTKITVDLHQLTLADPNDLFYGGLGATSSSGAFGYQGRPSGGNSEVGQMVDITFNHTVNRFFSWRFYYAHGFGSTVTQHIYQSKNDADMAYVDFNVMF